jgi:hypothetical protein
MISWSRALRRAWWSGAASSLTSAAVLALCGVLERHGAAGPLNGPSQWVHGRSAAYRTRPTLRHTLLGYLIHHLSATGWAVLHERLFGRPGAPQPVARLVAQAAATAAVANVVDLQLTPRRFRPGFEVQLSRQSLLAVYAAFAVGLVVADIAAGRQKKRH